MSIESTQLLLSAQRALWGVVTPNLRTVSIRLIENHICLFFYYDSSPTEMEKELAEEAATEVIADFPEPYTIECNISMIAFPQKIEPRGFLVFSRYE